MWFLFLTASVTIAFSSPPLQGVSALSDVTMDIEPPIVESGQDVLLTCNYDLEEDQLYSLKWYKKDLEIFRYVPYDVPPHIHVFPLPGLQINLESSNKNRIVLQNMKPNLSANFTCEVTTESPHFHTAMATRYVSVVEKV